MMVAEVTAGKIDTVLVRVEVEKMVLCVVMSVPVLVGPDVGGGM